ncbi:hypothetical protein, partial [Alcanivorax sp.]|uniref:hypothetical protein n=2 Tax=Alcanivorax TaxID=59753 RepID=UPI0025845028
SSELTKTLLTRSELKSLKDPIPNRSHTFACLIVKERLVRGAALLCVVAPSRSAHSRDFTPGVKSFFSLFLKNPPTAQIPLRPVKKGPTQITI